MTHVTLEPGWLSKELQSAHIDTLYSWSPRMHDVHGLPTQPPISRSDADELYAKMNERFRSWTGRDLAEYTKELGRD